MTEQSSGAIGEDHPRATVRLVLCGVGAFALTHAVYLACGVRFQAPLDNYWEYVDAPLLTTRLLESLVYLHSQPPLFNLFLGVVLKLFPAGALVAFHAAYLLAGLALYLGILMLMRRLGVSSALAFAASTAFMIGPAFVLYEHLLFYMLPIALLLVASHLLLYEGLAHRRSGWLIGFFALIAVLCALQSVFHLVYYLGLLVTVVALGPGERRRLLRAGLTPLLALGLLYVKNLYLFGIFTTSSWSGMHMADMTVEFLPAAERQRLAAAGELAPVSLIRPFSAIDAYPARYLDVPSWAARIVVLSAPHRASGATNYHHLGYLAISRQYGEDARRTALAHPSTFARALVGSWAAYFKPSSDYFGLEPNRSRIDRWRRVWAEGLGGQALWPRHWPPSPHRPGVFLVLVLPTVWVFGVVMVARGRVGRTTLTRPQRATLGLMCANIVYVAVVVNSLTAGENNRFRFVTDPLSLVVLAVVIERWLLPRVRRRAGISAPESRSGST